MTLFWREDVDHHHYVLAELNDHPNHHTVVWEASVYHTNPILDYLYLTFHLWYVVSSRCYVNVRSRNYLVQTIKLRIHIHSKD